MPARFLIAYFCCLLMPHILWCQVEEAQLLGSIRSENGQGLPGITVVLKGSEKGTVTDVEGSFGINNIRPGQYKLQVSGVGFDPLEQAVSLAAGEVLEMNFRLQESAQQMDEILIVGQNDTQLKSREGFQVDAIDAKGLQNTTANLNEVLIRNPGINVRQKGGLGAEFDLSLNGLSGRQIRFFMDGLPMDHFGSALSLNNIPVNLIDRVEVYKGVVPVYLGSDALGGAVNIITKQTASDYLDASYAVGSFNTHRLALSGQYHDENSGFLLRANAYHNYSDNNYWVDVQIPDPSTGQYGPEQRVRRFHDAYRSSMGQVEVGFKNKSFADELLIGLMAAGNNDELQHGVSMDRVFGRVHTTSQTFMPSFKYRKTFNRLSLKLFAAYQNSDYQVVDTSAVTYNWLGEFKPKNNQNLAESGWEKSLFTYNDVAFQNSANLSYELSEGQQLVLNYTQSYFQREGNDPLSNHPVPFEDPNILDKKVMGLSYRLSLLDESLSATFFSKVYNFSSSLIGQDWDGTNTTFENELLKPGYGMASSYQFSDQLRLKASYEHAFRLPDGYEMFGDGLLLLSNPQLQPEKSDNFNLGMQYQGQFGKNQQVEAELNFFLRDTEDLIRIEATGLTSQYVNQRDARSSGFEAAVNYKWGRIFFADFNISYQNIINTSRYENGSISYIYKDRIPNIPYLFSNQGLGVQQEDILRKNDRMSLQWRGHFVEQYFLKWPSLGSADSKHIIPRQYVQDVELTYSLQSGKYNLSLACTNLTNARVFDHFRLQRPGRAFQLKARYFITQ